MTYEVQKRFAPQWFPWLDSDNGWKRCCKCVSKVAANQFLADEQKLPSYTAYEYRILECEE